jgi:hypothetical protein
LTAGACCERERDPCQSPDAERGREEDGVAAVPPRSCLADGGDLRRFLLRGVERAKGFGVGPAIAHPLCRLVEAPGWQVCGESRKPHNRLHTYFHERSDLGRLVEEGVLLETELAFCRFRSTAATIEWLEELSFFAYASPGGR